MNEAEWRKLPVGAWFFTDDPSCIQRYSVMERTSGGCVNVCSSCWHHDGAKKDMKSIADDHYAAAQLAEKDQYIETLKHERNEWYGKHEVEFTRRVNAENQLAEKERENEGVFSEHRKAAEARAEAAEQRLQEAQAENQSLRTMRDNELFDAQEEVKGLRERLRQREAELEQVRKHCKQLRLELSAAYAALGKDSGQPLPSPPKEAK